MNTHGYEFYIQEVDKKGNLLSNTLKNLEADFNGLKYSALSGVDNIGAVKNIYTEKYADSGRVRISMPAEIKNDATQLTLTLYFMGENRASVFKSFCEYIQQGIHRYWDTARKRYFDFYIEEAIETSDELWYGTTPYFRASIKMNNIFGKTFSSHEDIMTAYNK